MATPNRTHIFLSYSDDNQDFVEALARRLQGDARLSFWFGPWHSLPGQPVQEQMERALWAAGACAVFIGSGQIEGWQSELRVPCYEFSRNTQHAFTFYVAFKPDARAASNWIQTWIGYNGAERYLRSFAIPFEALATAVEDEHLSLPPLILPMGSSKAFT
jgi:hypothetical protein